jgi:predicted GNAT family acetyltransferase
MNADSPHPVSPDATVVRNDERSQYELWVGDLLTGLIAFRSRPERIVMIHTEVDDRLEGQGLGGRLVSGALDDVRARGLQVTPLCPFVAAYIREHPEYADLVAT